MVGGLFFNMRNYVMSGANVITRKAFFGKNRTLI